MWSLWSNDKPLKKHQTDKPDKKKPVAVTELPKSKAIGDSYNQPMHNPLRRFSSTLINDEQDQIEEVLTPQLEKKTKRVTKNSKEKEASKPFPIMSNLNKM
jgi:hypothetical protein